MAPACVTIVGCAAPAAFGGLSVLGYQQAQAGAKTLFGDYSSREGERVQGAFSMRDHPGDTNRLTEIGISATLWAVEALALKGLFNRLTKGSSSPTQGVFSNDKVGGVTESTADRAKRVHSALDPRAQRMRTTAVTETQEGVRVISSSNRRLSPAQRAQLGRNEVEGVGVGHAEVTGVNAARDMGLNPTGTAASRLICSNCARSLADEGVNPLSRLK